MEAVNHPAHYGGDTTYEVIKVIEAWGLDADFCLGNAVKYIARSPHKGSRIEDLKKAQWYLARRISQLEKEHASLHSDGDGQPAGSPKGPGRARVDGLRGNLQMARSEPRGSGGRRGRKIKKP